MSEQKMPGVAVDIPPVLELADALGYRGNARYVAFRFSPSGDQAVMEDGRYSGTAQTWAFLGFVRHRAVAPLLSRFDLGSSEEEGRHALVIDRLAQRASVAPLEQAREFLHQQWPTQPPLSPEQEEAFRRKLDELMAKGLHEVPVDHEAVVRAMEEQRGRIARMMSFLDMCPVPPWRGRGA